MAAVIGSVRADVEANIAGFKTNMGAAGKSVQQFYGSVGQGRQNLKGANSDILALGKSLGVAFTAAAIGDFVKDSVQLAAKSEQLNRQLVGDFGDNASAVEQWAQSTGDSMGRFEGDLRKLADQFGKTFKGVLADPQQLAAVSEGFAKLSVDVAAFYGISDSDAGAKIQQAIQGSNDALKDFGITLNDNQVAAKALSLGLASSKQNLTEADKEAARAAIVYEQLASAQGAAAAQAGTFAGESAHLDAQIKQFSETLGGVLLPIVDDLVTGFNVIMKAWHDLWGGLGDAAGEFAARVVYGNDAVDAAMAKIKAEGDEAAKSGEKTDGMADAMGNLKVKTGGATDAMFKLTKSGSEWRTEADKIVGQIIALEGGGGPLADALADDAQAFDDMRASIKHSIADLKLHSDGSKEAAAAIGTFQYALSLLDGGLQRNQQHLKDNYAAQEKIANLQAKSAQLGVAQSTAHFSQSAGLLGFQTSAGQKAQDVEESLAQQRIQNATDLATLEKAYADADYKSDVDEMGRLTGQIALQKQYGDLVNSVSAQEIITAQKRQELLLAEEDAFAGGVTDLLEGLRTDGGKFDFKAWGAQFIENLGNAVIEQKSKDLTNAIFGFLGLDNGSKQKVQTIEATYLKVASASGTGGGGSGDGTSMLGSLFGGSTGSDSGTGDSSGGDFWGGVLKAVGSFFGGSYAEGGYLSAGQWGIAGEHGPEVIQGGRHGISAAGYHDDSSGGGKVVNQTFNITTPNPDAFRSSDRQIAQRARRGLAG